MNCWGTAMLATVEAVAELAARGLGLPADAFTSFMRQGPHLLAPTGTSSFTASVWVLPFSQKGTASVQSTTVRFGTICLSHST